MKKTGFSLIELLIAIAIVGILATIIVPSYQRYTRKAHYSEIVQAASPYKIGIDECFQVTGDLAECQAGKNGVPNNIASGDGNGMVDSITVEQDGKTIIVPTNKNGIKSADTYELIPSINNDALTWATGGGGVAKGYAN